MSQVQLNLQNLIDGYDEASINPLNALLNSGLENYNSIQHSNSLPSGPLTTNPVNTTTRPTTATTNQNYPTQGSKRTRTNDNSTALPRSLGYSGLTDTITHNQNAPKRSKNDKIQPLIHVPHASPKQDQLRSNDTSRSLLMTSGMQYANQGILNDLIPPISSTGFSIHGRNYPEGSARNNDVIFSTPLGLAPATTGQEPQLDTFNIGGLGNIDMPPGFSDQFGASAFPFESIKQIDLVPSLPRSVTTTGASTMNNALLSIYQTPQGTQESMPQCTQDLLSHNFNPFNTSASIREQSPGLDFIQSNNISWNPTQEAQTGIPHIVIESEPSPRGMDAVSPLSNASTGYSSYRPRSPKNQHVTRASTANAFCEVLNPRREYDKIQKKFLQGPRRSEQRVQCGGVKLKLLTKIPLGDSPVQAFVKREPNAAQKLCQEHPDEYTMEDIRIPDVHLLPNENTTDISYSFCYRCELDLDSVYLTDDGKKEAYKLVKSKGAINNLFQLWLKLVFNNGQTEKLMPYEFVLKSGRTAPTQQDHNADGGLGIRETIGPKSNVSCKYLRAETAKITNIHCEYIQTENHDIAYFMRVRCEDENKPTDLEKGDVVAFLEDDEGDTYIDFLTSDNAKDARLAGVISRTAFFRGRKAICDPDHVDSDLVCIIGEVDVKVHGKVRAGDLIYTSNCLLRRGTAIARNPREPFPEVQSDDADIPRPTLLGMAMESYSDIDIKLVRCLVSIVLGIGDLHQRQTLEELRNCSDKIVKIQKYLKGVWKKMLFVFLFLLVAGILCYVFLAPNSPYLIMKCEKGCVRGQKGSCLYLNFDYYPYQSQEIDEIIGINFKWKTIKKKLKLPFSRCPNMTDLYYYLNKNRCVTGNIRAISSWLDTTPQVPRVNVLAVNSNCSDIYYFSVRDGWVAYDRNHFQVQKCQH